MSTHSQLIALEQKGAIRWARRRLSNRWGAQAIEADREARRNLRGAVRAHGIAEVYYSRARVSMGRSTPLRRLADAHIAGSADEAAEKLSKRAIRAGKRASRLRAMSERVAPR